MDDLFSIFSLLDFSVMGLPLYAWAGIVLFCSGLGIIIKGNR